MRTATPCEYIIGRLYIDRLDRETDNEEDTKLSTNKQHSLYIMNILIMCYNEYIIGRLYIDRLMIILLLIFQRQRDRLSLSRNRGRLYIDHLGNIGRLHMDNNCRLHIG